MFQIPTFEEIRDSILRDTQSLDPTADTGSDSDHFVHASRLASVAVGQYAHQAWIVRQIFPDTADSEYLERHANLRGLRRRNATAAAGYAGGSGATVSAVIPEGLHIRQDGRMYLTTAAAAVGRDGRYRVAVRAAEEGLTGNVEDGKAQFMAAPAGVPSDCVINAEGGSDAESDASLLARLLEIIRRPPAGGNRHDYKNWALSIDGVHQAYVYPLRRGLGTVDVVITAQNGLPSDELVQKVQTHIDEVRPVTAKSALVIKPAAVAVPVTAQIRLEGIDLAEARRRIQTALAEYFDTLIPGDSLILSKIEAAVSNVGGVSDRRITAPAANREADKAGRVEWFRLGAVNLTVM